MKTHNQRLSNLGNFFRTDTHLPSEVAVLPALKVDGKAGSDHGGIIQYYEALAKFEARKVSLLWSCRRPGDHHSDFI
jgi:hypothetical protein